MKMKPYCAGYPVGRMLEEEDAANERMLKAIFGDMDQEEYEDYLARSAERRRQQRDAAVKKARALLRQMNFEYHEDRDNNESLTEADKSLIYHMCHDV